MRTGGGAEGVVLSMVVKSCGHDGFSVYFLALNLAAGGEFVTRTKCSAPRSSSSHCTSSPGPRPMAAAKAREAHVEAGSPAFGTNGLHTQRIGHRHICFAV